MIRLFVYGELMSASPLVPRVSAPGDLRRRGTDAAARFGQQARDARQLAGIDDGLVWGQIVGKSWDQLMALDEAERPEYSRVFVRLSDGSMAWAYQDVQPDFFDLPAIVGGMWSANVS